MRVAGAGNIFPSHMGELFQGMDDKQASNIIQQASEIICNILKTEQSVAHGNHWQPQWATEQPGPVWSRISPSLSTLISTWLPMRESTIGVWSAL